MLNVSLKSLRVARTEAKTSRKSIVLDTQTMAHIYRGATQELYSDSCALVSDKKGNCRVTPIDYSATRGYAREIYALSLYTGLFGYMRLVHCHCIGEELL